MPTSKSPGPQSRLATMASNTRGLRIPRNLIPATSVILPDLRRYQLTVTAIVVSVMGAGVAGVGYLEFSRHLFSLVVSLGVLAGGIILTLSLIVGLINISRNFGILLDDEGMTIFLPTINPRTTFRRTVFWTEMRKVVPEGFPDFIMLSNDGFPVTLDRVQAGVLLTDPRCPLAGRVPDNVALRINVATGSS